ncbi:MAG: hypothetical protein H6718_17360 [Polyangiaceae bacterium]|nr:hypothetical protein [Myxococcales bacterium]MCB9587171.1 hypothetical protein [Polyangiaceae bacterium]
MASLAIKLGVTLSTLLLAAGCRGNGHAEERPPSRPEQESSPKSDSEQKADATQKPGKELTVQGKHELPVKFPAVKPEFEVGQRVLAVPQNWLETALEVGVEQQVISLYDARVTALGAEKSEVKSLSGALWSLPNAVIVPLPAAAKVKLGDLVLTHWPQGGSWMRAVVVDAAADATKARLLDVATNEPAGWGKRVLELEQGSFVPLSKPGQSGTTAACKVGTAWRRFLVIQSDADNVLALGFAGKLSSLPKTACRFLALAPKATPGASVWVPWGNKYLPATVRSAGEEGGRTPAPTDNEPPAQAEAKGGAAPPAPSQAPVAASPSADAAGRGVDAPGRIQVELQVPPRLTLQVPQLDLATELPD